MIITITTVVTAAEDYDLTDLATIHDELGISDGDTSNDTFFSRVITQASTAISNYCNRVFQVETVQDLIYEERDAFPYQVPGGVRKLQVSRFPIVEITSLVEDVTTLVEGTDFMTDQKRGQLIRLNPTTGYPIMWPSKPITVIYSAGFASEPADIQDAVIRLVKLRYFARTRDPLLKQENADGVGSSTYWVGPTDTGLPPDIQDLLDNYRVPVSA